jgi:hypothetical protein
LKALAGTVPGERWHGHRLALGRQTPVTTKNSLDFLLCGKVAAVTLEVEVATQKYEYMTERFNGLLGRDEHTTYVNKIASYGWRLIAATDDCYRGVAILYFERPVEASDG